jgi:hypothetical protein
MANTRIKGVFVKKFLMEIAVCAVATLTFGLSGCFGGKKPAKEEVPVAVTSVIVDCQNSFKVTQKHYLSASVIPSNATDKTLVWEIVSATAEGAALDGNELCATGLGTISVKATATKDGVQSSVFTITVKKEPVTNIVNTNTCTEYLADAAVVETFDNPYDSLKYTLVNKNNYITADEKHTGNMAAYICVGATNQWQSEYLTLKNSFPLAIGDKIDINFWVKPAGMGTNSATSVSVLYSPDNGKSWVTIKEQSFSGTTTNQQWTNISATYTNMTDTFALDAIFRIKIDGTVGTSPVKPVSAYVDDVSYEISKKFPAFTAGESLTLQSTVYPITATNQAVTYEIIQDGTTAAGASLDGNTLTATGAGIIKIRPIADGTNGTVFYVKVI